MMMRQRNSSYRRHWLGRTLGIILCCLHGASAEAELVRLELIAIESPTFDGKEFGSVGRYEKLTARAFLEVDPEDPRNAIIADLDLAPRNSAGRVEFVADVMILKPVALKRGNNRLLYGVVNRGRKLTLGLLNDAPRDNNPTTADDAGNGFLMREGYTLVWSGWQANIPAGEDRMRLEVPTVSGITGTNQDEFIFEHNANSTIATLSYPAANLDPAHSRLTVRQYADDPPVTPSDLSFKYLEVESANEPPSVTRIQIQRPEGFDGGAIYEFTYPARDPAVMGLAFAATRDIVSFLRREIADVDGNQNPLTSNDAPTVAHAYSLGISQSGRFLRDFVYQGFNEDEGGQLVFDGVIPHVAGSRKTFTNARWAQPGRYSRQHETRLTPGDQFPFTYGLLTDVLTGETDGVLGQCLKTETCPKVIHTDTSTELWQARASLIVTDTAGADIDLPPNVRAYLLGGAPHSGTTDGTPRPTPTCQHLRNPIHVGATLRALLHALDRWQSNGIEPPSSHYPSHTAGSFVLPGPDHINFPAIPGVSFTGRHNDLRVTDYSTHPPRQGAAYPVYVSKIDADGNDTAGIRLPVVQVPQGTYLGWNHRREGHAAGALCSTTGSYLPFSKTRAARDVTGDPRLSLEERYPDLEGYTSRIQTAVTELLDAGFLLEEDAIRMVAQLRVRRPAR